MAQVANVDKNQERQRFLESLAAIHQECTVPCHLRAEAEDWAKRLLALLFPHFRKDRTSPFRIEETADEIGAKLDSMLEAVGLSESSRTQVRDDFWSGLPGVRSDLVEDATAMDAFDPASESVDGVILAYPGFYALAVYRLANLLYTRAVPLLPRLLTEYAHRETGIDIHPGAQIAVPVVIDHGTGLVIGQSSVIGKRVKLYQGVTLGALAVQKDLARTKRHPTIKDDVVLYAGATILGGDTVVGERSVIGGNAWVTRSVPAGSTVTNRPAGSEKDQL